MAKVLVVDDEPRYRDLLSDGLAPGGHVTRTAASGREAIDVGTRFRPDVVVTDWMLKNHIHGLHVATVLRGVLPDIRTILMTGFASKDLRANAKEAQVIDFIEKPFGLDEMLDSVQRAVASDAPEHTWPPPIRMIEVDADGAILFATAAAKELLAETSAGPDAANLADVFSPEEMPDLDAAADRWDTACPRCEKPTVWQIRSQTPRDAGSRLLVLRRQDEPQNIGGAIVKMLLELTEPQGARWPFEGRVLVVDDQAIVRRAMFSMLENTGAGCYAAENSAEALRLLENDEGIEFVIHDHDMPPASTAESIERIKAIRPDVVIVGTSGSDRRDDFAALGVEHFLQKPWRCDDLVNVLIGRIGNCDQCGLALPLRLPRPSEQAGSWVCTHCGSRYRAVLDDASPADAMGNARPAED